MRKIKINSSSKYKKISDNLFIINDHLIKIESQSSIIKDKCRICDFNVMNCMTNNGNKFSHKQVLCFIFRSESKIGIPMSRIYLRVINRKNSLLLNLYINKLRREGVI